MRIYEYGGGNPERILLIHPSLVTWDYFENVIPLLEKQYHLLIPALPGYDLKDDSEFSSVERIASDLADAILQKGIQEVKAIYGCSMGGSIALRMAADGKLKAQHYVMDGGITPYQLPWILTRLIALRDFGMMALGKLGGEKMIVRAFSSSQYSEEDLKYLANMFRHCTYKTLWNTFDSCNNYQMPKNLIRFPGKIHYWYAEKERKARDWDLKYMKKFVPDTVFKSFAGMDHGDMALFYPEQMAQELRSLRSSLFHGNWAQARKWNVNPLKLFPKNNLTFSVIRLIIPDSVWRKRKSDFAAHFYFHIEKRYKHCADTIQRSAQCFFVLEGEHMEQKSNAFLETEKLSTLMRKYSLPCIISLVVAALYNIVDQIFIANADYLGSYGNAANTVVFPLTVVALAIAVMIGDGACAFVSISLGADRKDDAHRSIGNAIVLCLGSSLILTAVYLLAMEPILTFFGGKVNAETYACAKEYFFWIALGMPFYMFGQAMLSWDMEEASEAFAAVNAFYNHAGCGFVKTDAKTLDGVEIRGRTVGMVGMMIGHSNMTQKDFISAKKLYIMDREEKAGALPDSACEYYLPLCDLVIITGSAAINKTMPRLLELSRNTEIILTGPTVTCCPELLALGISRLSGRVVTECDAMLKAIVKKRTSVNRFSVAYQVP